MDVRAFVATNRDDWERLEAVLGTVARSGLTALSPPELRDLGLLHRRVSADLAAARTLRAGPKVVDYLNDLALRSHNVVYSAPRRGVLRTLGELRRSVPAAVRAHAGALGVSTTIFATGVLLGAFGTALDEGVARSIMGAEFVEKIQEGEYWVVRIFSVVPSSVLTSWLLTNNLSVAIALFAFGITGLVPALVLFNNGLMLGAVLALCTQYGLLPRFLPFLLPHAIIEISAILLAGAGGFTIFDGWLNPGDRTRLKGLGAGAREGLLVAAAAAPALVIAAFVEGSLSPVEAIPGWLRIVLGVSLGLALWSWLTSPKRATASRAA